MDAPPPADQTRWKMASKGNDEPPSHDLSQSMVTDDGNGQAGAAASDSNIEMLPSTYKKRGHDLSQSMVTDDGNGQAGAAASESIEMPSTYNKRGGRRYGSMASNAIHPESMDKHSGNILQAVLDSAQCNDFEKAEALMAVHVAKKEMLVVGCSSVDQETALVKATKHGYVQFVRLMLRYGADPLQPDGDGRSAWFYVSFSLHCTNHKELAEAFCSQKCKITADVLQSACLSSHKEVAQVILDHVCPCKMLSKSTVSGRVSFAFENLILLDDTTTRYVWEDGTVDLDDARAQSVLTTIWRRKRLDLLQHPSVLALLTFKWNHYGKRLFWTEFALHLIYALLCCWLLTLAPCAVTTVDATNAYSGVEWLVGLLSVLLYAIVAKDGYASWVRFELESFDLLFNLQTLRLGGTLIMMIGACYRFAGATPQLVYVNKDGVTLPANTAKLAGAELSEQMRITQQGVRVLAIGCLCSWLNLINYLQIMGGGVGSYFIMVVRMLGKDVVKFLFLVLCICPGFFVVLTFLSRWGDFLSLDHSNVSAMKTVPMKSTPDAHAPFRDNIYGPSKLFYSLVEGGGFEAAAESDTLTAAVLVLFLILGPVLTLNLLIAMMSDTFAKVKDEARSEWAFMRAQYVIYRESFVFWKSPYLTESDMSKSKRIVAPSSDRHRGSSQIFIPKTESVYELHGVKLKAFDITAKKKSGKDTNRMLEEIVQLSRSSNKIPIQNKATLGSMSKQMAGQEMKIRSLESKLNVVVEQQAAVLTMLTTLANTSIRTIVDDALPIPPERPDQPESQNDSGFGPAATVIQPH